MSMEWNFDIEQAPKGTTTTVQKTIGKAVVNQSIHVPALIIASGTDGVVTLSKWLPKEERWNMFSKNVPPLAWMPWPSHPDGETE